MALYTTGELARACGVSVRTLQFYDAKGLLKPTQTAAGGRRLYDEAQLKMLQLICMYKSLGFSLHDIQHFCKANIRKNRRWRCLRSRATHWTGSLPGCRHSESKSRFLPTQCKAAASFPVSARRIYSTCTKARACCAAYMCACC